MKDYKVSKALFTTSGGSRGGATNIRIPIPADWASDMNINKEERELVLFKTDSEIVITKKTTSFFKNKSTGEVFTETEFELFQLKEAIELYSNLDEEERSEISFDDFLLKLSEKEQDFERLFYSETYNDWMTIAEEEYRNNAD